MTDRCEGTGRREHDWTPAESACEPSAEQKAAAEEGRSADATREAEARRDAYITGGTDEGGRCRDASSDPSTFEPWSRDSQFLRNQAIYERTKHEPRVESDPWGNAIVSAVAGGVIGGVRAAGGQVGKAGGRALAETAAKSTASSLAKTAAKRTAVDMARSADVVPVPPRSDASGAPSKGPSTSPSSIGDGGQSSPGGASRLAPEPNRSEAPRIPEVLPPTFSVQG